jgi:hypothetical protein
MAAFFVNFQPRITSLYLRLAEWIRKNAWKGTLASLNYDRLLERSLRDVGLNVSVGDCPPGSIEFCLPHGYCCIFIKMQLQGPVILGSKNLKMDSEDGVRAVDDPVEFQRRIERDQLPPRDVLFRAGKRRQMWRLVHQETMKAGFPAWVFCGIIVPCLTS